MPILLILPFLVGCVLAIKMTFWVMILIGFIITTFGIICSGDGIESFIFVAAPLILGWLGVAIGWVYYYINFQPATAWSFGKAITWLFTP